jgi:hypothetical protein
MRSKTSYKNHLRFPTFASAQMRSNTRTQACQALLLTKITSVLKKSIDYLVWLEPLRPRRAALLEAATAALAPLLTASQVTKGAAHLDATAVRAECSK